MHCLRSKAFEASGEASPGRLEQMRQAMMQAAQEAEREQHARLEAEKALQEALKENQLLKNEIDRLKGIIDTGHGLGLKAMPRLNTGSSLS
eukprot:Skav228839  [mRNA]  locus=scaffold4680:80117:81310:+ [translate_table: standard]